MLTVKPLNQPRKKVGSPGGTPPTLQPPAGESGFTIIESLMALMVVVILMVGLSPILVMATAARVQARRVELATQAAKTYIDGVTAGAINPPNHIVVLAENNSGSFSSKRTDLSDVSAPALSAFSSCASGTYCSQNSTPSASGASLYCVDIDGDGDCTASSPNDLIVQGFRSVPSALDTNPNQGYILGVRVYRAYAFHDSGALKTQSTSGGKQAIFVGTLGDYKAPLMEITTEISSGQTEFQDYCQRFGGCQ